MARPQAPHPDGSRQGGLGRYLLDGEQVLTAVHHHWAKIAAPVAAAAAGLVPAILLDSSLPAGYSLVVNVVWWAWLFLVVRALWHVLEWRNDWFVATDQRLLLTYGLITRKVAMMPLAKVTDMSYNRSPTGRLLGYGTFVMESAGQDQALHRVHWVPNPDHNYRAICAEMFGVDDHERVLPDAPDHERDRRFVSKPYKPQRIPYEGYVPPDGHAGLPTLPRDPGGESGPVKREADRPSVIRIRHRHQEQGARHPGLPNPADGRWTGSRDAERDADERATRDRDTAERGTDDRDPTQPATDHRDVDRDADTGPIPLWDKETD